jgi:NADH-quinone oxidoreductase subunit M
MLELHLPWLELAVILPAIGALWLSSGRNREKTRTAALVFCFLTFALTLGEWFDFSTLHTFEAHDHWDLVHRITSLDILVVDELSAPLLPLTALIFLMTVLSTLPTKVSRFPFGGALALLSLSMATLSSREPWVLIGLLILMALPPWLDVKRRNRSTVVFGFHMGLMGGLMIIGQLLLSYFDVSSRWGQLGAVVLAAGCLIRCGIVPVHCWMTDLFEKASFGVALLFVTPISGAYAVMRLVYPVVPSWVLQSVAIVSLFTAIYGAGMALVQTEARRFFCYLFLSFSSLVLVGIELASPIGLAGALCIWLSVGLSLTGFGLSLRSIESRTGRLSLREFNGLYEHAPRLAALFLLTGLASIGFPGTVGFIGIELLVEGAVSFYPLVGIAVVIVSALNGIAILSVYFRVFTGTVHRASVCLRAQVSERVAVLVLACLIIGGGLVPQPGVSSRYHAASALLEQRGVSSESHVEQNHVKQESALAVPVEYFVGIESSVSEEIGASE